MATLINDRDWEMRLIQERTRTGRDLHDEVWEGVYMMAPSADWEHQRIVTRLAVILETALGLESGYETLTGLNVSDREEDWRFNYRVPDVAVVAPQSQGINRGAFALGGPDFLIEVVSPGDHTRDKLDFYAQVGAREVLIVDREPWQLELLRLVGDKLESVGVSTVNDSSCLASEALPLEFQLVAPAEQSRPRIKVRPRGGGHEWLV
jgi:Uma2 family endonuclease